MFPKDSSDFEPLANAAFNIWAPGAKIRYSSLLSGFSGAAVLKVDVRGTRQSQVDSGQYVLKLSHRSEWRNFESELQAYDNAYKFNKTFAKFHIPALVRSLDLPEQNGYAMLYEIAGASLDAFISMDGPEKPEFLQICQSVISDLLNYWAADEPDEDCCPYKLLESWLGYRLLPDQAPNLHDYVKKMAGFETVWNDAGEMMINPLKFYELAKNNVLSEISVVNAWLHYDLHGGNLLVHRMQPAEKPYQIIDLGQSQLGPAGFDLAYLEVAEIVYCLGENDPTQLINLLKHLDDPNTPSLLPPHTSWLYDCLRKMRTAFSEWRDCNHPRRIDDLNRQMRLAQMAAGLNWANKPLPDGQRYLGLCYAGWAAREYLRLYDSALWDNLWPRHHSRLSAPGRFETTETDYALWEEFWGQVQGFASTAGKFVLVTEAQRETQEAPRLSAIGQIPWSAVIDLDPVSDTIGLHRYAAPVLQSHRGLHTFDKRLPTVDYQYGTAWMMAAGWDLKGEALTDYDNWIFDKLHLIRSFAKQIETKTSPDPIYVLALPGGGLDAHQPLGRVSQVLQALYEVTRGRARVFLLGSREASVSFKYTHLPLDPEPFMQFVAKTFGGRPQSGIATIPGNDETGIITRELPVEDLRTLQENMEILHSNILNEVNGRTSGNGATFWRGAPPSWADLQQGVDIPRTIHKDLVDRLRSSLEEPRNRTVVLYHHPGAGATTEAYRVAWDLHREYPACILTRWSEALSARLQKLYRLAQRPILLVAEAPTLTETQREDLHRDLSQNNTPVILLYLRRGFHHEGDYPFRLEDPMTSAEAKVFFDKYQAMVDDPSRKQELERITREENLARYRTPFFYGLITHERQFIAVDRYVGAHIQGVRGKARDLLEYIALVTIYSNTGMPETLVKLMLGLPEGAKLSPVEIFGEGPARLISVRQGRIRLMHQVIAEELLSDLLGGGKDDWQFELHHLAVDLIHDVVAVVNPDSQVVHDLFRQIFIERMGGESDELDDHRDFSPLIERIDHIDKSLGHRVLTILKDSCPNGAHFWNHLGRHQIYRMQRDFEKAEEYLRQAIALSPDDYLHYHTLGVVLRSRVRETIHSLRDCSANELLEAITFDFNQAVEAFEMSRQLSPENIYGYITHIQMILAVASGFKQLLHAQNIGQITSKERPVQNWIAENIPVAHKLLTEADQLYGTLNQTDTYLTQCYADLQRLYGDMDQVITIWEIADAHGNQSATSRRALANAYVARKESRWSKMQHSELLRIVELMELNIHSSGRRDEDYRLWFEAYKLLPEFDIDEAMAKLRLWINYFPSWRAYYYVYILQFFLWYSGRSESTDEMEDALEECQKRIVGRKSYSGLWLGYQPDYCPLVSASELGEWNRRVNLWSDTSQLLRVNGVIDDPILSVQSGWILVDGKLRVFFVPAAGSFSPHVDENRPVSFFLGFSPTGLRAWDVKPGHLPNHDRVRPGNVAPRFEPTFATGPSLSEKEKRERVRKLRQERVMMFIEDLMQAKAQIEADLTLEDLEKRIEAAFGIDGIAEALGVKSIHSLLEGIPGYKLTADGKQTYVRLMNESQRAARLPQEPHTGKVFYFHQGKGYGFIDEGSSTQYFFRRSHILPEYRERSIYQGADVNFVPEVGLNGPMAIKIRFLSFQPEAHQDSGDLLQRVEMKVRQVLNDALITNQTVLYVDLCKQLYEAFPGKGRLTERMRVTSVAAFLNTLEGIRIIGEHPDLSVELREKSTFGRLVSSREAEVLPTNQKEYLREQIKICLLNLVAESERDGKPLKLTTLGDILKDRFPGEPIYKRLGFEKLSELIKSFSEFTIERQAGYDYVGFKSKPNVAAQPTVKEVPEARTASANLAAPLRKAADTQTVPPGFRAEVKAYIDEQLDVTHNAGRLLDLPTLGDRLIKRFPGEQVYKLLGYKKLVDFLYSFNEYKVQIVDSKQILLTLGEVSALKSIPAAVGDARLAPDSQLPTQPTELAELRQAVELFITEQVLKRRLSGQLLDVPALGVLLTQRFPGERIYKRLGFKKLGDLLNSTSGLEVQTVGATQVVALKDQNIRLPEQIYTAPLPQTHKISDLSELREAVRNCIDQLLVTSEKQGITLNLVRMGYHLQQVFTGDAVRKRFGFRNLANLVRSFPEFAVIHQDGDDIVRRMDKQAYAVAVQLRAESLSFIQIQIEAVEAEGQAMETVVLDRLLKEAFPDMSNKNYLGFTEFLDFLRSFTELQVLTEPSLAIVWRTGTPRPPNPVAPNIKNPQV